MRLGSSLGLRNWAFHRIKRAIEFSPSGWQNIHFRVKCYKVVLPLSDEEGEQVGEDVRGHSQHAGSKESANYSMTPTSNSYQHPSHSWHLDHKEKKFTPCKVRHSPSGIINWVQRLMMIVFPPPLAPMLSLAPTQGTPWLESCQWLLSPAVVRRGGTGPPPPRLNHIGYPTALTHLSEVPRHPETLGESQLTQF